MENQKNLVSRNLGRGTFKRSVISSVCFCSVRCYKAQKRLLSMLVEKSLVTIVRSVSEVFLGKMQIVLG